MGAVTDHRRMPIRFGNRWIPHHRIGKSWCADITTFFSNITLFGIVARMNITNGATTGQRFRRAALTVGAKFPERGFCHERSNPSQ